ncbi:FecR family protein [Stenotrophomonas sp. LGBM10]|uniref:FecR family protein n=1 Tax=Stenotrophomonas sp. LGBM10 TaxID=3390038 RepID=UPI00398AADF4
MSDTATDPAALTRIAAHWHALQRQGELSPAQQRAFLQWVVASPAHLREYLAISRVAGALGDALRAMPIDLDALIAAPPPPSATDNVVPLPVATRRLPPAAASAAPRRRRVPGLAVAAALLLGIGLALPLAFPTTAHHVAGHGAPRRITLPDQTVLHLNAESEVAVRYTLLGRRLELVRGQASVEVAADRRPFVVHAAGLQVTDIGTTFDVSLQREQARIGVSEGRVQVRGDSGRLLADLGAGQAARVDYRDQRVQLSREDAASITAWWQGRIVFRDEPLREVADRFNRINHMQLQVADDAGALRLTGNLRADDVASLRAFLDQQPTLRTHVVGNALHVQGSAATVR